MNDETRAFLRHLFDTSDAPPKDIVPGQGLTLEALRDLNAAADTYAEVTMPGEVMLDVDGMPIAVGPSHTESVFRGGACIHAKDLERLGLTVEDARIFWPELTYYDPKENDHA